MAGTPKPGAGALDLAGARWERAPGAPPGGPAVEIARVGGYVAMRAGGLIPPLVFTPAEWAAFVAGVRDGEFDFTGGSTLLAAPGRRFAAARVMAGPVVTPGLQLAAGRLRRRAWLLPRKVQESGC